MVEHQNAAATLQDGKLAYHRMDVAAEGVDTVSAYHHDRCIVLLKILRNLADGAFVPVIEFFRVVDRDFAKLFEAEIIIGDDDAVVKRKSGCKGGHRKGDEFGVGDLSVNAVVDRRVDAGVFPAVIFVVKQIDEAVFPDGVENGIFRIDRELIGIELGRKRTVINAEKIFSEHR